MLFNSISFLIFFPIVFLLYYLIPVKFRNLFLLIASLFFYMSFVPEYVLILLGLITVDYFLGILMNKAEGGRRRTFLIISVVSNIGVLLLFKYFNFFSENIATLAHFIGWNYSPWILGILLPLGLSFHVFQSLSYVIEVYKKRYIPERNYITYALYVMFFPQLVAGPIERPQHLLAQLNIAHSFDSVKARQGLERMLWGFFKKLVIADQLAQIINPMYANLPSSSPMLIVLAIMFSYQLYCDFSGYSDIAIGAAKMLGYDLTENFNRPYAARTFADFWRRWHISLSSWLKDYLYYPLALGWGKISKIRLYFSLFITFVLIGLWHGPNWTFVVFGAIHGMYLIIESLTDKIRKKLVGFLQIDKYQILHRIIQTIIVFSLVSISFIFFRSESITEAWWFVTHMFVFGGNSFNLNNFLNELTAHTGKIVFLVTVFSIIMMEVIQFYQEKKKTFYIFDNFSKVIRYGWYYGLSSIILLFGYFGAQTFIYFQF